LRSRDVTSHVIIRFVTSGLAYLLGGPL